MMTRARHLHRSLPLLLCCALCTSLPSLALAQANAGEDADEGAVDNRAGLEYWSWGSSVDQPSFDPGDPTPLRLGGIHQRARTRLQVGLGDFGLHFEADWLSGQLSGDAARPPARAVTGTSPHVDALSRAQVFDPRELYLSWALPVGQLRLGLQTSDWGLGMLANNGKRDYRQVFGQRFGGDRVWRALFATKPFQPLSASEFAENTYLAIGADIVHRDDFGNLDRGDIAYQAVGSLFYRWLGDFYGGYVAYRDQQDTEGSYLQIWALDLSATRSWDINEEWMFFGRLEVAHLRGSSDRNYPAATNADTINIRALGIASEWSLFWRRVNTELKLLAGFASGDANNDDETLYRFRFDPNYKVGLILFDHYLPAITRMSYRAATNPDLTGTPPRGIANLVSDGGVQNAYYLNPQILVGEDQGLLMGLGLLWALAHEPVADPYQTFANGGMPTNVNGQPASRELGVEIDLLTQLRQRIFEDSLTLELRLEYGLLLPGDAFRGPSGALPTPQNLVRGRVSLLW